MPAMKAFRPRVFPYWYKVQQAPANMPSLQQVASPPFQKPLIPSSWQILVRLLKMPPFHLSCPPYSQRVQRTERGLERKTLIILADKELKKGTSLELFISSIRLLSFQNTLREEKNIDELNAVLSTLGMTPLQKALKPPSSQRNLVEIDTFLRKFLESCIYLGGTSITILMFSKG